MALNIGPRRVIGLTPNQGGGGGIDFRGKMGVHPYTPGVAGLSTWDAWFGGVTDFVTVFVSHSNWSAWDISIASIVSNYTGDARRKVWTMGLCVTGTTLDDAAAGTFNSHYRDVAVAALADAPADGRAILVRIGHEFNLAGTYPWETINSGKWTQYAAAYRQAVGQFRAVSSRFRFIWCTNWITLPNPATTDLSPAWPGDSYVDLVASDLYYNNTDDADPTVAFNYARDLANCGLAWLVNFGAAHGKPVAMCEFGLNWDKPQWIDAVYQWVKTKNYAYAAYWDHAAGNFRISDGSKPDCTARFRATFRDGGPSPIFNHTFAFSNEGFGFTGTAQFSVVSAVAQVTNVSNFSDKAQKTWTGLTIGATYRVELDLDTGTKNARLAIVEQMAPNGQLASNNYNSAGAGMVHRSFTFTATQTSVVFQVIPNAGDAAQIVKFDNVMLFAT